MKRLAMTLWGMTFLALLGLVLAVTFPQQVFQSPLESEFSLEFPSFATMDGSGAVFVIDKSLGRIRKISADGSLVFQIDGQNRAPGALFYAVELAVDEGGYLYVLNQSMQENGFYTEREEILRYSPTGQFDRIVGSRVYAPQDIDNTNVTRGRLTGLSYADRRVSWFELGRTGVIENTVGTETWRLEQTVVAEWPDSMRMVASVVRLDRDTVMISTKQGTIVQVGGGPPQTVYSADEVPGGELSVPWWLGARQGQLLFSDLTRGAVLSRSPEGSLSVVLDGSLDQAATEDRAPAIYYTFSVSGDGSLVTTNDRGVLSVVQGKVTPLVTGGHFPLPLLVIRLAIWVGFAASVVAVAMVLFLLYRNLFGRRISLIFKQLMVSLPLMTAILWLVSWTLIDHFTTRSEAQSFNHISQAIQLIAQGIDADRLDRIQNQSDFMNQDYRFIRNQLHAALNHNQDPWNAKFYFALHRLHKGTIYTSMYLNDAVGLFHPFNYLNDPSNLYRKAAEGRIVTAKIPDAWGTWILGVGPVYNAKGEVSALLEVGRDLYGFQKDTDALLWSMIPFVGAGFLVLILLFVLSTRWFLEPLRRLRGGVNRIAQGQWDTSIPIRGSDEVAEVTVVFNRMASYIRNYIDEIMALSQGYRQSVPQEILVPQWGDQVQRDTTVMFTDLRAFTSTSQPLPPKENFAFLTPYRSLVGPEVRRREGFVDQYIGDAIQALFPQGPDDALQAAIAITDQLARVQPDQGTPGQPEVRIGVGIHTGPLMLGPEGTVISDNVNLASRLEGLTQFFDASIIVSETTFRGVKDQARYHFRSLGRVKVKGKKDPVNLYEVLDGLPTEARERKVRCQPNLEAGIVQYQNQDFRAAEEELQVALQLSPEDTTVKLYLTLCRHALANPPTDDWSGTITMNSK